MRNAIVSFAFYMIMILLCILFQFVDQSAWVLAFLFAGYAFIISPWYKDNCTPLEIKDFFIALLFTVLCIIYWYIQRIDFTLDNLAILYTVNFIASVNLGCSNRYKILI